MRPIRLLRGFLTVGFWTLASRILGLIRDLIMAAMLGSSAAAEAFQIAFSLPNMFRRFFAEGAFNMAFVPLFSKRLERGDDAEGFARDALSGLGAVLILFTLLAQLAMPALVWLMASGFVGDARFDLAVGYGRIMFVYILLISLAALASGVLNATGRFAAAAAAPVLLNIILIAALYAGSLACVACDADTRQIEMGRLLSYAVPLAGLAQLGLVWWAARRAGIRLWPRQPQLTPELKRLFIIAAPAALAGGVVQVNLLVGRQVASQFEGAVAWLYYADRLYQLPLGVVGIAIGIVLLPDLSRRLAARDERGSAEAFNRAMEFGLMLTVPAAVALTVIPIPLISVLFERGAFGARDTVMTAQALAIYGLGLPAFVLQKLYQPLYFAREDTKTPFRYALIAMVLNLVLAIGLMPLFGYLAAAIATSLSAWGMLLLLALGARQFGSASGWDARLRRFLPRLLISAALMGAALLLTALGLGELLAAQSWRYLALAALIGVGLLSLILSAALTGAFRLSDLRAHLKRGG